MLTVAGAVLGVLVPGIVGAGPTATLVGTILAALLTAFFTTEGQPTLTKTVLALLLALAAVTLTVIGVTITDLIRGQSLFGDRTYTFPVDPVLPDDLNPDEPIPRPSLGALPPGRTFNPAPPPDPTHAPDPTFNPTQPPDPTTGPTQTPDPTIGPTQTPDPKPEPNPEVQEERVVELSTEPGKESVEIDWWRSVHDKSGDLQMDQSGIYTTLGAKLSVIEDSPEAIPSRCSRVQTWTLRVDFATLHEGSQLCAQSRGGRYAMLQVRALPWSEASNGRFIFYGRTWKLGVGTP